MVREFLNWLLVLFVLSIVSLMVCRASAAPAQQPQPLLKPYPFVRMLRGGEQSGQPLRNVLRKVNDARPGIIIPKLPVRPQ